MTRGERATANALHDVDVLAVLVAVDPAATADGPLMRKRLDGWALLTRGAPRSRSRRPWGRRVVAGTGR